MMDEVCRIMQAVPLWRRIVYFVFIIGLFLVWWSGYFGF